MNDSPTPFQRHAVLEYVKTKGWCAVAYRNDFFSALSKLNELSRQDENAGKWYIVQPVTDKAVA